MEIMELHPGTTYGLALGSRLVIPEGVAGIVAKDGVALDTLPPGDYLLEASLFPLTLQKLKLKPGMPLPDGPLPAALFLVQTGMPWVVSWRCSAILSKNPKHGLTYTTLEGRATVQVSDPARFCGTVLAAGGAALGTGGATPASVMAQFLQSNLQKLAAAAVEGLAIPPELAPTATEAIRTAVGHSAAGWLHSVGLYCPAFDLDTVAPPRKTPCIVCGSATAPTGYALFQRNISLLYLRFTARREGNFCVPCAWKTSAAYNGVMLVAGWWGLIGLVLTPIYFFSNLYYLSRVLGSAKTASSPDQLPRSG